MKNLLVQKIFGSKKEINWYKKNLVKKNWVKRSFVQKNVSTQRLRRLKKQPPKSLVKIGSVTKILGPKRIKFKKIKANNNRQKKIGPQKFEAKKIWAS